MDFLLCFECHMASIICSADQGDSIPVSLDKSYEPLLRAFQAWFPNDKELNAIGREPPWKSNRQQHEIDLPDPRKPWSGRITPSDSRPRSKRRFTPRTTLTMRFYGHLDGRAEFRVYLKNVPAEQNPRVITLEPGEIKRIYRKVEFAGGPLQIEYVPANVGTGHVFADVTIEEQGWHLK